MKYLAIAIVVVAAFLGALGQLLFKKVSGKGLRLLKDWKFYMAGALYGISAVMFIIALKYGKLVVLYPIVSTSYIWTSLLAMKYLGERMNSAKWAGIVLIMIGVSLIIL